MTTITEHLRAKIEILATTLDHLNKTPPGTALRGIYFWHWPGDQCGPATLQALYLDAATMVRDALADELNAA